MHILKVWRKKIDIIFIKVLYAWLWFCVTNLWTILKMCTLIFFFHLYQCIFSNYWVQIYKCTTHSTLCGWHDTTHERAWLYICTRVKETRVFFFIQYWFINTEAIDKLFNFVYVWMGWFRATHDSHLRKNVGQFRPFEICCCIVTDNTPTLS